MIFTVQPDINSPSIALFNNGAVFPPGAYVVRYGSGVMAYSAAGLFQINAGSPTSSCFFVTAEGSLQHTPAPGLNTTYATAILCEAGNAGQQVIVTLTAPSTIGIWLDDSDYSDNTTHGEPDSPIFELDADVPPYDPESNYKALVLSDTPVIYYRLGEPDEEDTAFDSSGNNHHGTYHGNVQHQQEAIITNEGSPCVYFTDDGYVDIPVAPLVPLTNATVECWFIWDSDQPNQRIFDFNNGVASQTEGKYFFCSVYHHLSGLCRAAVSLTGLEADVFVDSVPIIANRKYHAVCTLGGGKLAIFINGQKIQETETDITLADLNITQAWISRSPWSVDTYFKGKKDEFAIYPRILGDDEILDHYLTGTDSDQPPSGIKNEFIDDNIIFNQTVTFFKQPAGGGQIYSFTVNDVLAFAEGASGPPHPESLKDTIFFVDTTNYSQFPTRRIFKDQLVFIDSAHGSPHRVTVKDTLVFTENPRHNQHKNTLTDTLVFTQIPDPHWFEEPTFDHLDFDEIIWHQNNHQYWDDILLFVEDFIGRFSIKNEYPMDLLTFNEAAVLRWSIANITIIDTLAFVEELHRVHEEDLDDILVFDEFPLHVHPESIVDELEFDETIDFTSSTVFIDTLTLVEVFCVESTLSRSIVDTLVFRQYAAFLINGPDDPRNGGGNNGPGGGVNMSATYRRAVYDRLTLIETIITDPAPTGKDCVVEIN
jgi:hypothetical protein